jgi:hypothetical protein
MAVPVHEPSVPRVENSPVLPPGTATVSIAASLCFKAQVSINIIRVKTWGIYSGTFRATGFKILHLEEKTPQEPNRGSGIDGRNHLVKYQGGLVMGVLLF